MIQKTTLVWFLIAAICGVALFQTSDEVHQAQQKLQTTKNQIVREQENIRVLEAEWSYLNRPARLEKLAAEVLDLQPVLAQQVSATADLPTAPVVYIPQRKPTVRSAPRAKAQPVADDFSTLLSDLEEGR